MKPTKILGLSLLVLAGAGALGEDAASAPKAQLPFVVYKDGGAPDNKFVASGFTGDHGAIRMADKWTENPKSGESCLKFTYTGQAPQQMKWAGVFFQHPANNWGTSDGGVDLSAAKKLKFYARGDRGGESVEFKFGGVNGAFSDSDSGTTGPIILTRDWKQYEISLQNLDVSYIFSGFAWIAEAGKNPEGFTIYLDDIAFVNE